MALQLHSGKNVVETSLSEKDLMKLIASTYCMSSKSMGLKLETRLLAEFML